MTEKKRFNLAYEKGNWWAVRDGDITLWKEEVVSLLNELSDENKQIKHMIQEAYETERTAIGKNVLKQLMEAIE